MFYYQANRAQNKIKKFGAQGKYFLIYLVLYLYLYPTQYCKSVFSTTAKFQNLAKVIKE